MIGRALDRTEGNRYHAAKLLGIDIALLDKRLEEHRLTT